MAKSSLKTLFFIVFSSYLHSFSQISITKDSLNLVNLYDKKIDTLYAIFGEPSLIEREKTKQKFGEDTRGSDEALYYKNTDVAFLTHKKLDYTGYLDSRPWLEKLYYENCYINSIVINSTSPLLINNNSFDVIKTKKKFELFFNSENIISDDTLSVIRYKLSEIIDLEYRFYFDSNDQFLKLIITEDI